jgi:hypothetical protein
MALDLCRVAEAVGSLRETIEHIPEDYTDRPWDDPNWWETVIARKEDVRLALSPSGVNEDANRTEPTDILDARLNASLEAELVELWELVTNFQAHHLERKARRKTVSFLEKGERSLALKKQNKRGRPFAYPKALRKGIDLLNQGIISAPGIYRQCVEEFGELEPIPDEASFLRNVRRRRHIKN